MTRSLLALAAFGAAAIAGPAQAQTPVDTGDESYNMVIVYGDDACPTSDDGTIVVCARQAESERFRIPESMRFTDGPQAQSWAERVEQLEMVGSFGTLSCSPVGAGGMTGCTQEMIRKAYADKENSSAVRFGEVIAAARADRLSTIDEDAERTQEDVEMIEREYMQRLEEQRDAPTPDESELPQPNAKIVAGDPES
ncbi:hypothetical protein K3175_12740 [Qipengyuania sp. GH1]|uniref:hypothetical protein n=1 Tax=Qipengyuania aestuarii TaxID=2867241 RepID=UPI001C87F84D|nr:hypothetical protein [Qipengyuania aestuarii]MBX7536526.1 hypothetical protein [Qipengyuania aestuarii]